MELIKFCYFYYRVVSSVLRTVGWEISVYQSMPLTIMYSQCTWILLVFPHNSINCFASNDGTSLSSLPLPPTCDIDIFGYTAISLILPVTGSVTPIAFTIFHPPHATTPTANFSPCPHPTAALFSLMFQFIYLCWRYLIATRIAYNLLAFAGCQRLLAEREKKWWRMDVISPWFKLHWIGSCVSSPKIITQHPWI